MLLEPVMKDLVRGLRRLGEDEVVVCVRIAVSACNAKSSGRNTH